MIDYHIHTKRCNHASGEMKEYVVKAIKQNLKEICFLDHLTLRNGINLSMLPSELPNYISEVYSLQKEFKDKITIKLGLEVDYNSKKIDLIKEIISKYHFDAIGSSVHFVGDINVVISSFKKDNPDLNYIEICEQYIKEINNMLDEDYFDIVCHLDIIKKNIPKIEFFEKEFEKILDKIKRKNFTLEYNTSGYAKFFKDAYPSSNLLKKVFEKEIDITIGSDAHAPNQVGRHYDIALKNLKKIGFSSITTFTNHKKKAVKI